MSENVLVFELFSGVGWCNQLFSLESAVYLANITNRKLVVFVEHPIAHCGGMNWDYGTVFDYLSDDFKEYLPNGFEYYTKSLPEKYLQDKEGGYLNIKRDVVKWSGIVFVDKKLDIPENNVKIEEFLNGKLKRHLRDELFETKIRTIRLCGSNASRCFYNFYTTRENYILMSKISLSLRKLNKKATEICEKYYTLLLNFLNTDEYLSIHFRFGDSDKDNLHHTSRDNMIILNNLLKWKNNNPKYDKYPLLVMADREKPIISELNKLFFLVFNTETPLNMGITQMCYEFNGKNGKIMEFLVQKYACEKSKLFIGTNRSTLSVYIQNQHYLEHKPSDLITKYWHGEMVDLQIPDKIRANYTWYSKQYPLDHHLSWQHFWVDNIYHTHGDYYLKIHRLCNVGKQNKKIISYCLFNAKDGRMEKRHFTKGILINYHYIKEYYPDWIMRVYYPANEPLSVIEPYLDLENIEFYLVDSNITKMAWRFLPYNDYDVDMFISRDLDSIVNDKEAKAVEEWLYSNKSLHIMHDYYQQYWPIMGGTLGIKNDYSLNIVMEIMTFLTNNKTDDNKYGLDCEILNEVILKNYRNDLIQHFSAGFKHKNCHPYPPHKKMQYGNCVGDICSRHFSDLYQKFKSTYEIGIKKQTQSSDSKTVTRKVQQTTVQGKDKVSVVITQSNDYARFLKAVDMVNNQTYKNIELITIIVNPKDTRYYNKIPDCTQININDKLLVSQEQILNRINTIASSVSSSKWLCFLKDNEIWNANTLENYVKKAQSQRLQMVNA